MFELTGKTALITGATGAIGGSIARVLHAQGATVGISGTRREVLDTLAADLGGRVHVLPCNLADSDGDGSAGAARRGGDGPARHAGRQCRGHQRQSVRAVARRRLGAGDRHQSHGDIPAGARGGARHDAPPLRPHHRHHFGGGSDRQSRAGQLRCRQGRHRPA